MFNNIFCEMTIKKLSRGNGETVVISSWKCNTTVFQGYTGQLPIYPSGQGFFHKKNGFLKKLGFIKKKINRKIFKKIKNNF